MSRPTVPAIVERAYELLGPLTIHDSDENEWALMLMVVLLLGADQELWELTEDPGLAVTLRPEGAPPAWLEFIGSINGARLTAPMTTPGRRVEIRSPSGWARGFTSTLEAKVAEFLVDGAEPRLVRRARPSYPGDQPHDLIFYIPYSQILPGQLPALRVALAEQMVTDDRGWIVHTTWGEEASRHPTWGHAAAAHGTWGDMARGH